MAERVRSLERDEQAKQASKQLIISSFFQNKRAPIVLRPFVGGIDIDQCE